jgi:hypothetical protein
LSVYGTKNNGPGGACAGIVSRGGTPQQGSLGSPPAPDYPATPAGRGQQEKTRVGPPTRGRGTVDTDGIKQRIDRLDQLSRGLAKEVVLLRAANDPLLYLEQKAYLAGIQDALAGVEGARVALARARQRLLGQAGKGG